MIIVFNFDYRKKNAGLHMAIHRVQFDAVGALPLGIDFVRASL